MKVTELQHHHAKSAYNSLGSLLVSLPNKPRRGKEALTLRRLRSAAGSLRRAIKEMKSVDL
jgi:hypothetical protein